MKKILLPVLLIAACALMFAFGKKQNTYDVKYFEDQYSIKNWLNENQPSQVLGITTTGTWWTVFYIK